MSFDIVDGTPYLVRYAEGDDFCKDKDASHYQAEFFRWKDGTWTEISQTQFPVDKTLMNLDSNFWGGQLHRIPFLSAGSIKRPD